MSESEPTPLPHPYWIDGIDDPKDTSRLVKRVKLSDLMNYDPRASYRHKRLWEFHLGWAHKEYGWTSLASVRHIRDKILERSPDGRGMSTRHIADANRDLVDWQYLFEDELGRGHRGTRYSINWSLLELAAAGQFPPAYPLEGHAISVSPMGDTTVSPVGDTKPTSVSPVGDKDPITTTRLEDGASSNRSSAASATPPPPAAGLSAASAGQAPQGSFEDFWSAYAHKQQRAKAKAAWAKLDPDAELSATITTEAGRWAAHYAEHEVEPRWRVLPHNWLAGENWLQDLPIVHKDSKSAAIANVRGKAKPASRATPAKPATRTTARVTAADVVETGDVTELRFTATDVQGVEHERIVVVQHYDAETQFAGQRQLTALVHAAGLEQISDSAELLGRTVVLTNDGNTAPTTRPDDEPPLPKEPEPVVYANPPSALTESEVEEIKSRVAAAPPLSRDPYGLKEWERRYKARQERKAGRREWDAAHPEFFEDKTLPPRPDDWPAWMDSDV